MKKRGLGRGLDALLSSSSSPSGGSATHPDGTLRNLPVERIVRSRYQPRQDIDQDTLQALADSIRAQGVVQPIVVRTAVAGRYEIIAGERRWRAAQLVGLAEIPALIREVPEQSAMAMALVENIQREDLNAMEEAVALKRLIEHFELTHQQAAEAVGRSRVAVSNLLRLLDLDEEIQGLLRENKLEMGHARALLSLPLPLQREASKQVLMHGLSVRETEALVRRLQQEPADAPVSTPLDPNIRVLQSDLSTRLGAKVLVKHTASGRGRLVIHYNSLDELDGILNRVK